MRASILRRIPVHSLRGSTRLDLGVKEGAVLRSNQALVLVLSIVCGACTVPTEDSRRLQALRSQYGNVYTFQFEDPLYLRVTSDKAGRPDLEELKRVFEMFWLDDSGRPRNDSNFVYLNAYDRNATWQVQLCWDPASGRIVAQKLREHY
jgi:hypothetical protein